MLIDTKFNIHDEFYTIHKGKVLRLIVDKIYFECTINNFSTN